jgi:hypothetical protein
MHIMTERAGTISFDRFTDSPDDPVGDYVVRLDRNADPAAGSFGELESFTYTVADDGGPFVEVHVEVEALIRGDTTYSRVAVRRLGSRALRFGGAAYEIHVTPPLIDESERQQAVLASIDLVKE